MGLDVTAYTKIKTVGTAYNGDEWEEKYYMNGREDTAHILIGGSFEKWAEGLEDKAVVEYDDCYSFRAGAYSAYNRWREWLSKLMVNRDPEQIWNNPEAYKDNPFFRIINFSDCEGIIGPVHSKILAKAFADYQHVVDNDTADEWYKTKYANFRKAFEMAADNGFVEYH